VRAALDAALPEGLDVVEVVEASGGSLADRLTASQWRIATDGVPRAVLDAAAAALLAVDVFEVERMTKSGLRTFDARAAIIDLRVVSDSELELVSRHGAPLVRPDDVVQALGRLTPAFTPTGPPLLTRLAQGEWRDGRMVGPFEA